MTTQPDNWHQEFEPDQFLLNLLGSEHQHGTWIGKRLLAVASRIRSAGGSKQDYNTWVQASYLWSSYRNSTSDRATDHGRHLEGAWRKSADSKPFDLEEALAEVADRVAAARWVGRTGSRDRAVALAFIGFCSDRNCFTRTISCYELSKHTAGISPATVNRALIALVKLGVLTKLDRTDKRPSNRSTCRYQVNLFWKPTGQLKVAPEQAENRSFVDETRSTCKDSLSHVQKNNRDLWSVKGLGQTPARVFDVLTDEPQEVKDIALRAGVSTGQVYSACRKLAEHCLAGMIPGRPVKYFRVDTPLEAVEDMLGVTGFIEGRIERTELRQEANRKAFPQAYQREPSKVIVEPQPVDPQPVAEVVSVPVRQVHLQSVGQPPEWAVPTPAPVQEVKATVTEQPTLTAAGLPLKQFVALVTERPELRQDFHAFMADGGKGVPPWESPEPGSIWFGFAEVTT
jgi:hypothetical protein